jgi:hypothetical protein
VQSEEAVAANAEVADGTAPLLLHRSVDVSTWSAPLNTDMVSPVDANS